MKIGFATFWKTGYCLAIFGEANCDDLKKSARHSQYIKDLATYAKDAEGVYKQHLANPVPMNCVQKWSNIHVDTFGQSEVMSALQGSWTVEIGKLPEYYVQEVLKIPKGHQYETNMLMLLHLAKAEATKNDKRKGCESAYYKNNKFAMPSMQLFSHLSGTAHCAVGTCNKQIVYNSRSIENVISCSNRSSCRNYTA